MARSKDLSPARSRISRSFLARLAFTVLAICCSVVAASQLVLAYKLSPEGTALEKSMAKKYSGFFRRIVLLVADRGVPHFMEPVHEEITHRIFGCEGEKDVCGQVDIDYATPYVLVGVRWNDDPPFQLEKGEGRNTSCNLKETIRFTTQPMCWAELFRDAKKKASEGKPLDAASRTSLLGRSHFGDLQFLHAMASKDGELAAETQKRIMMWAEFTWKVSRGQYGLGTMLKDVSIAGFEEFFGRSGWTVQDLFTLGNPPPRQRIDEVAFGSLLHTVEDSFAKGHVYRAEAVLGEKCAGANNLAPGRIRGFHAYNNQDTKKHAESDSRNAFTENWTLERPNVIDVGRELREYNKRESAWEEVKPYLECVFRLEDPEAKASPGEGFEKDK